LAFSRLLKIPIELRFWEGHDLSRAVKSFKTNRALAPAGCRRHQQRVFQQPLGRITLTEVHVLELAWKARKVEKVGIFAAFFARKRDAPFSPST
jgi:hypothetical protein